MRNLCLLLILALGSTANACEGFATVGKALPSSSQDSVGIAGVGCRFDTGRHLVDASLLWVGEASLYDGALRDDAYPLLTVSGVWQLDRWRFLGGVPELYAGLGFKEADRCAYNGESNCNRRQPLPWSFHFGFGWQWREGRVQVLHDSNNSMDWGPEAKNLGLTWLTLTKRFN